MSTRLGMIPSNHGNLNSKIRVQTLKTTRLKKQMLIRMNLKLQTRHQEGLTQVARLTPLPWEQLPTKEATILKLMIFKELVCENPCAQMLPRSTYILRAIRSSSRHLFVKKTDCRRDPRIEVNSPSL